MENSLTIGLIGLGTVGSGVVDILRSEASLLAQRSGVSLCLLKAACRDTQRKRDVDLTGIELTTDPFEVVRDPRIDVVVEVMGGVDPARELILEALRGGKHVVTSNKEVVAKHGTEFLEAARESGKNLYFEAAVGGGIPILHGLKNCLAANRIRKVFGILNGTTNFILSKMHDDGADFSQVLQEAQALGFAEADPSSDVDGYDAAYKLAILGGIAFNSHFTYDSIHFEGIRSIAAADVAVARELGYVIKLVALGIERDEDTVELRVHPLMIEKDHPLANVSGSFNAAFVEGNHVGETMFYGPGAGRGPTASAVVGDLMDLAMGRSLSHSHPSIFTNLKPRQVLPMGEVESEYFLRLLVCDEPGVLAEIAGICARNKVSLLSVHQKEAEGGQAELVIITHRVREAAMQDSLDAIRALSAVLLVHNLIRVGL